MDDAPRHHQVLADFWLADPQPLRRVEPLWPLLLEAARASGATVLADFAHQFEPHGFTGVLLLAQSHLSVHTWAEQRLMLLDVQSCGPMQPDLIVQRLRDYLRPVRLELRELERGT